MRFLYWAVCGTLFTFAMTALGAALVFFFGRAAGARVQKICIGFAGGVMSAAAVFSLLVPAAERAEQTGGMPWLVLTAGFLMGAGAIALLDMRLEHVPALMFSAVTLHNIPEGMAVALACASASENGPAGLAAAAALALGVGVQNLPEGAAVALPLSQSGMSRLRSFLVGVLSGAVEPVFGVLAVLLGAGISGLMPLMMAFAAGAMMQVVFAQMLPDAAVCREGTAAAVIGYALMMALDVALG